MYFSRFCISSSGMFCYINEEYIIVPESSNNIRKIFEEAYFAKSEVRKLKSRSILGEAISLQAKYKTFTTMNWGTRNNMRLDVLMALRAPDKPMYEYYFCALQFNVSIRFIKQMKTRFQDRNFLWWWWQILVGLWNEIFLFLNIHIFHRKN